MEKLIAQYESTLAEYRSRVMEKMSPQDWRDYNEVLFSAHSCAIEGNSFSVNDTRELKERGLGVIPVGKTLLEAFEILDHFDSFEYMLSQVGKPLSEPLLKEVHRLCTKNTLSYRTRGEGVPGNLLETTQAAMERGETHPVCIAARFHCFFEYLHPFRDGNGRTGRLMANFILLSMGHPMVIIPNERKSDYLLALQMYRKEHTVEYIEYFFLQTAISRMQQEMADKQELTARSQLRFII